MTMNMTITLTTSITLTMSVTLIAIMLLLVKIIGAKIVGVKIIGKPFVQTMTLAVQVKILETAKGKDPTGQSVWMEEETSRRVSVK